MISEKVKVSRGEGKLTVQNDSSLDVAVIFEDVRACVSPGSTKVFDIPEDAVFALDEVPAGGREAFREWVSRTHTAPEPVPPEPVMEIEPKALHPANPQEFSAEAISAKAQALSEMSDEQWTGATDEDRALFIEEAVVLLASTSNEPKDAKVPTA
jgi:hypothetical protein